MAEDLKFRALKTVPSSWEPNTFYALLTNTENEYVDCYITSKAGIPKQVGNKEFILSVINNNTPGSAFSIDNVFNENSSNALTNSVITQEINNIYDEIAEPPIYQQPTVNINLPYYIAEVGKDINSFYIQTVFNQNDAGSINNFKVYKEGQLIVDNDTPTQDINTVEDSFIVQNKNYLYKTEIGYEEGPVKNNSIGNPAPSGKINAGTVSNTVIFKGRHRIFFGSQSSLPSVTQDYRNYTSSTITPQSQGNVLYVGTTSFQFLLNSTENFIAFPDYVDISNFKAEIPSTGEDLTSNFNTYNAQIRDLQDVNVNYKVLSMTSNQSNNLTLKINI